MDLKNKVTIITGGASGLGEATVRRFATNGAKVVIFDMNAQRGAALADELGDSVIYQNVNVTEEESVQSGIKAALDTFGPIQICCNYAGQIGQAAYSASKGGIRMQPVNKT